jgi:hypothetical protein
MHYGKGEENFEHEFEDDRLWDYKRETDLRESYGFLDFMVANFKETSITICELDDLQLEGLLPSGRLVVRHAMPGTAASGPCSDEVVMFTTNIKRSLSLPVHNFFAWATFLLWVGASSSQPQIHPSGGDLCHPL